MKLDKRLKWTLGAVLALAVVAGVGFHERPVSCFNAFTYLQEDLAGVQSKSVMVEGQRMHYLAAGRAAGPVVVLVHGLGGRAEDWIDLLPHLTRAGFRVYMPDLLGYGRSARPADFSYSVRDEAAAVVGFMDALGLKQVDLGGWSMGGWIVQLIAASHPERIRRLMLFDSAGLAVHPDWDTSLFTPTTPEQLNALNALLMPHPPRIPGFIARDILRTARDHAWVMHRAMRSMLTGEDATDTLLPRLTMPVLISWGALDRITPLEQGETMQRLIPQSELDVTPGCGHLAPRQCAGQEAPAVVAFLKR